MSALNFADETYKLLSFFVLVVILTIYLLLNIKSLATMICLSLALNGKEIVQFTWPPYCYFTL